MAFYPSSDVLPTDLGSELILLDPRNQEMYSLNGTGRLVWLALPAASEEDVAHAVLAGTTASPDDVRADVRSFLAEMRAAGLVVADPSD